MDSLAEEIGWQATYDFLYAINDKDDEYLADKVVEEPLRRLQDLISKYQDVNELTDISEACSSLIYDTQKDLGFIINTLDEDDNRWRMINDEIANLVMRLASRYYKKILQNKRIILSQENGW